MELVFMYSICNTVTVCCVQRCVYGGKGLTPLPHDDGVSENICCAEDAGAILDVFCAHLNSEYLSGRIFKPGRKGYTINLEIALNSALPASRRSSNSTDSTLVMMAPACCM